MGGPQRAIMPQSRGRDLGVNKDQGRRTNWERSNFLGKGVRSICHQNGMLASSRGRRSAPTILPSTLIPYFNFHLLATPRMVLNFLHTVLRDRKRATITYIYEFVFFLPQMVSSFSFVRVRANVPSVYLFSCCRGFVCPNI